MKCPKDGIQMDEVNVEGVILDHCKKCSGFWMDWGELTRVSGNMATEHELIFRGASNILCPRCGKKMNQADLHSVIVEECKCGLFFDEGEAEKVLGKKLDLKRITPSHRLYVTSAQVDELLRRGEAIVGDYELVLRR
jgi:Zn-finger nucleic acid-binding protein